MVLIPVRCPHCHSDQVIKGGKTKAGQPRSRNFEQLVAGRSEGTWERGDIVEAHLITCDWLANGWEIRSSSARFDARQSMINCVVLSARFGFTAFTDVSPLTVRAEHGEPHHF